MKISVVTPTYNRCDLLHVAIASIQSQTLEVSEIIIVDDGSTDGTQEAVLKLSSQDPRIKLVRQARGGANRARNAGIAAASGDWIAFLDSDDYWLDTKLYKQKAAIDANKDIIASFTGLRNVGGASESVYTPPQSPSLDLLRRANVLGSTSTALVQKKALMSVGCFDVSLKSCQDWDLWFRLRRFGLFAVVREPLTYFVEHKQERITTNDEAVFQGHREVFNTFIEGLPSAEVRRVSASHNLVLANIYLNRNRPREAFRHALRSFVRSPSKWGVRLVSKAAVKMITG